MLLPRVAIGYGEEEETNRGPAEMQARLDGFAMTLEMVEGGISDRLDALTESTEKTAGPLSALTARVAANSDASAGVHDSIATAILDLRSQVAKLEQAVNAASHSSPAVDEAQPPHPPDAGQGPNASGSLAVLQIKSWEGLTERAIPMGRGEARRGEARRGEARRGEARRGEARRGEARRGEARRGEARRGEARRGSMWLHATFLNLAIPMRRDRARRGEVFKF
ncbi:hypothetical protein QJQ45_002189 [Haematococcus lacustris]|nr:hypothetical protein QJQ45_002189 [Haematococcus lacustris]